MKAGVRVSLGVLLIIVGAIWALQGLNVLGGSAMSGVTLWAVIGPLVAVFGLALVASGRRRS